MDDNVYRSTIKYMGEIKVEHIYLLVILNQSCITHSYVVGLTLLPTRAFFLIIH